MKRMNEFKYVKAVRINQLDTPTIAMPNEMSGIVVAYDEDSLLICRDDYCLLYDSSIKKNEWKITEVAGQEKNYTGYIKSLDKRKAIC